MGIAEKLRREAESMARAYVRARIVEREPGASQSYLQYRSEHVVGYTIWGAELVARFGKVLLEERRQ